MSEPNLDHHPAPRLPDQDLGIDLSVDRADTLIATQAHQGSWDSLTVSGRFVVSDASLALKWVLVEQDSPAALALLRAWQQAQIQPVVPSWFACEVGNRLFQSVRRGDLTVTEAQQSVSAIMALVEVADEEPADIARAIDLATAIGEPRIYDTLYVAVAERLGRELWTADERFRRKVIAEFPHIRLLRQF